MLTEDAIDRIAKYAKDFYDHHLPPVTYSLEVVKSTLTDLLRRCEITDYCILESGFINLVAADGYHIGMLEWLGHIMPTNPTMDTLRYNEGTDRLLATLLDRYFRKDAYRSPMLIKVAEFVRVYMTKEIIARSSLRQYKDRLLPHPYSVVISDEGKRSIDIAVDSITNTASYVDQRMRDAYFINGCIIGNISNFDMHTELVGTGFTFKRIPAKDPFLVTELVRELCDGFLDRMVVGPLTKDSVNS